MQIAVEAIRVTMRIFFLQRGNPSVITDNMDSSVLEPGDLYTPYQVNSEVGANKLVQRFPYAESSKLYNSNYPGDKSLTTKVFWAK